MSHDRDRDRESRRSRWSRRCLVIPRVVFNGTYSSSSEMPHAAMDNSTSTKYLNFGQIGGPGFVVTPSIKNSTVACAFLFATGNDHPNRGPLTVTLEGSNASTITALHFGSSWRLIYNGSTQA